ncbi:LIC_11695 family lipoprotein [Leptospira sarikeiensis]|uniref:Lipoprotein n=1 Tax=Leptospira sarikeiensis TaxID=2484943 RepID=A0A4R9JYW4_9LEPT|nr:LIC_11695 family lipoprotein [Leptospira sarikeiensis]TGL58450.1 lipoprotein [Leptospira sarikeiensis]
MKKTIKLGLIVLAISATLHFCKELEGEEKLDTNGILQVLLLKKNSASEGESLGLTIAYSHRFTRPNGEIFFCREYSTAYLEKKAEWEEGLDDFVAEMKTGIDLDLKIDLIDGPCVVPNKVSACIYEGVDGINDPIPYAYSYIGEHEYLVPAMQYYGFTSTTAKGACQEAATSSGIGSIYKCYVQGQCWE